MNTELEHQINNKKRTFKGDSIIDTIDSYVVIDIETTGFDPNSDSIIELAALRIRNNEVVDKFQTLVNPNIEIDQFISNLTGITNDILKNAPALNEKIKEFIDFIGDDIIIGHNVNFDINFIYDNSIKILNSALQNDFIDTLQISKAYILDVPNYKLQTLAKKFNIDYTGAHRALKDCYITNNLYNILKDTLITHNKNREIEINNIVISKNNLLKKLKCTIKGKTKNYTKNELIKICKNNGIKIHSFFYDNDYDIIVLSHKKFQNYKKNNGNEYYESHGKKVIDEYEFYDMLEIPYLKTVKQQKLKAKDIISTTDEFDIENPLYNKTCVFTGTLEKMLRKEAMQIVVNLGGKNKDTVTKDTNYLILGNNDYCTGIKDGKSSKQKKAENFKLKGYDIEIISENVFYDMIEDFFE